MKCFRTWLAALRFAPAYVLSRLFSLAIMFCIGVFLIVAAMFEWVPGHVSLAASFLFGLATACMVVLTRD